MSGQPLWTFDAAAPQYGIKPASVPVSPIVADLDGVSPKEVLFIARYAPADDPKKFDTFHMAIFAVHRSTTTYQAELVWMRQPDWAHPLSYTHLVATDIDGDGRTDIFGMDWNTIGHKPGAWENLGPAHMFRLDGQGNDVWVRELDTWWSNQDILLLPDGTLLANGAQETMDGMYRVDGRTGTLLSFTPIAPWKSMRGPVQVQLDGTMVVAIPVTPDAPHDERGGILLLHV